MSASIRSKVGWGFALFACVMLLTQGATYLTVRALAGEGLFAARALSPVATGAQHLRGDVAVATTLLLRGAAGEEPFDPAAVSRTFEEAQRRLAEVMRDAEERLPQDDDLASLGAALRQAETRLAALVAAADRRLALIGNAVGVGSDADVIFDALYDDLVARLATLAALPELRAEAPAQARAGEARHALAHGHLILAEILGGDGGESFAEVAASFDAARTAVVALAAAGADGRLDAIAGDIDRLSALAEERHAASVARRGQIAEADTAFRTALDAATGATDAVVRIVEGQMAVAADRMLESRNHAMVNVAAALAVVIALAGAAYILLNARVVRRILDLQRSMDRLIAGDLGAEMPGWESRDELGHLRTSMTVFRDTLVERDRLEARRREAEARERDARDAAARAAAEEEARERSRAEQEQGAAARRQAEEQSAAADITLVVQDWARGDFSRDLSLEGKAGVYRDLCEGLNGIAAATRGALDDIVAALRALSDGDLTYRTSRAHAGVFRELGQAVDACAGSIADAVRRIRAAGESVDGGARTIGASAEDMARRTEQTAATLEETATGIEEMAKALKATEAAAAETSTSVQEIDRGAAQGTEVVSNAIAAMREIEGSSDAIRRIIEVIDGISFQTNLLALNAGVEAARAGEAGRGFAVVASEVRALASRSSEASREIEALIAESGRHVGNGVSLVNQTGEALAQIAGSVTAISARIQDIAGASRETAGRVTEISRATSALERATQQSAAMFEQTNAAVQALRDESAGLMQAVGRFRVAAEPGLDAHRAPARGEMRRSA
ncbi:methyl-accepting chemotaxis protein [Roseivivax isoporae]|uniref:Methyl-accepting chemotaxis protein n=1 Tax=Roseivivax isoporae LMG 25204 TaxID=1449351 RepID=X7FG54_9RHOB|nr:methyl-accepting chemotaxis protein [Roseivivax isoporae]ETX30984.1 methyl-accepting chemotaxis protein [Roseivivax isoporae LMG 25204]